MCSIWRIVAGYDWERGYPSNHNCDLWYYLCCHVDLSTSWWIFAHCKQNPGIFLGSFSIYKTNRIGLFKTQKTTVIHLSNWSCIQILSWGFGENHHQKKSSLTPLSWFLERKFWPRKHFLTLIWSISFFKEANWVTPWTIPSTYSLKLEVNTSPKKILIFGRMVKILWWNVFELTLRSIRSISLIDNGGYATPPSPKSTEVLYVLVHQNYPIFMFCECQPLW